MKPNIIKTITFILAAVFLLGLLSSCYPSPPAATLDRPTREESGDRIVLVAPDAPYQPVDQPASGDWPTRPLTLIVPFLPGGDTDMYARMFAPRIATPMFWLCVRTWA
ncbi:MAG: hypothetical protein FWE90_06870 [Defluviitaleaceae bacterium]|nr:hypothetical protein [Defluviitaleaceae bacterium]